jgi:hypothetical protein
VVCRGCCCGTARKHPHLDHDRQIELLRAAAVEAGSVLRVSGCRGVCHLSNVVALRHDNHRIEVGHVLTESATNAVADWIRDPTLVPDPRSGIVLIGPLGAVVPSGPTRRPAEPSTARRP